MIFSRFLISLMGALIVAGGAVHTAVAADAASDAALAEAVKAKLAAKNPDFLRAGLVEVSNGVVTLKGSALTPASLIKALQQAGSVPGVVKVVNKVSVRQ